MKIVPLLTLALRGSRARNLLVGKGSFWAAKFHKIGIISAAVDTVLKRAPIVANETNNGDMPFRSNRDKRKKMGLVFANSLQLFSLKCTYSKTT